MLVLAARPTNGVAVFGVGEGTIYVYDDKSGDLKIGFVFPKHVKIQKDRLTYEEFDNMLKRNSLDRHGKTNDREGNRKVNT